ELWRATLTDLELTLSKTYFAGYIKPLTPVSLEKEGSQNTLTLMCPTKYHVQMMEEKYGKYIVKAVERILETPCTLVYEVGRESTSEQGSGLPLFQPTPVAATTPWGSGSHNLNPRLSFETYIVGSSNNFAYAAAQGVAKSPGTRYNPLFSYGG